MLVYNRKLQVLVKCSDEIGCVATQKVIAVGVARTKNVLYLPN